MPSKVDSILALLQRKLEALNLSVSAADEAGAIDERVVDSVLATINNYHRLDVFEMEETEELEDSSYKGDEYEPVFDGEAGGKEFFSYEFICKVLDFADGPPKRDFKAVNHRWSRVRSRTYIARFRKYRQTMGTERERFMTVAKYTKEMFDDARARKIIVHDDDLRMWALHKSRELGLEHFHASAGWLHKFKSLYRISSRRITKFVSYRQARDVEDIENKAAELLQDKIRSYGSVQHGPIGVLLHSPHPSDAIAHR